MKFFARITSMNRSGTVNIGSADAGKERIRKDDVSPEVKHERRKSQEQHLGQQPSPSGKKLFGWRGGSGGSIKVEQSGSKEGGKGAESNRPLGRVIRKQAVNELGRSNARYSDIANRVSSDSYAGYSYAYGESEINSDEVRRLVEGRVISDFQKVVQDLDETLKKYPKIRLTESQEAAIVGDVLKGLTAWSSEVKPNFSLKRRARETKIRELVHGKIRQHQLSRLAHIVNEQSSINETLIYVCKSVMRSIGKDQLVAQLDDIGDLDLAAMMGIKKGVIENLRSVLNTAEAAAEICDIDAEVNNAVKQEVSEVFSQVAQTVSSKLDQFRELGLKPDEKLRIIASIYKATQTWRVSRPFNANSKDIQAKIDELVARAVDGILGASIKQRVEAHLSAAMVDEKELLPFVPAEAFSEYAMAVKREMAAEGHESNSRVFCEKLSQVAQDKVSLDYIFVAGNLDEQLKGFPDLQLDQAQKGIVISYILRKFANESANSNEFSLSGRSNYARRYGRLSELVDECIADLSQSQSYAQEIFGDKFFEDAEAWEGLLSSDLADLQASTQEEANLFYSQKSDEKVEVSVVTGETIALPKVYTCFPGKDVLKAIGRSIAQYYFKKSAELMHSFLRDNCRDDIQVKTQASSRPIPIKKPPLEVEEEGVKRVLTPQERQNIMSENLNEYIDAHLPREVKDDLARLNMARNAIKGAMSQAVIAGVLTTDGNVGDKCKPGEFIITSTQGLLYTLTYGKELGQFIVTTQLSTGEKPGHKVVLLGKYDVLSSDAPHMITSKSLGDPLVHSRGVVTLTIDVTGQVPLFKCVFAGVKSKLI